MKEEWDRRVSFLFYLTDYLNLLEFLVDKLVGAYMGISKDLRMLRRTMYISMSRLSSRSGRVARPRVVDWSTQQWQKLRDSPVLAIKISLLICELSAHELTERMAVAVRKGSCHTATAAPL